MTERRKPTEPQHGGLAEPVEGDCWGVAPSAADAKSAVDNNGLRDETGALIGGLVVLDYVRGMQDFDEGRPPPEETTPSYDLGRQRAAEDRAAKAEVANWLKRQEEETERRMRAILTPEQYAEYRQQIDRLCRPR